MKIDKKAIEYRKKKGADFFIIQGEKNENFSGCAAGAGGAGVVTIRPEVILGYGKLPESLEIIDVDGEKVVVFFEVESCITPETEIKLDSVLFAKTLLLENAVPLVLKKD